MFDRSGLKGRVLSSSYIPAENQPGYESMMKALNLLFDKFQVSSKVTFEYKTKMFLGAAQIDRHKDQEEAQRSRRIKKK